MTANENSPERGFPMRSEFSNWAGKHQYMLPIERDLWVVWVAAWQACLDKVDAELEGIEASNALRDHITETLK